jgi:DNA-binding CsgD family transcriptional regulator
MIKASDGAEHSNIDTGDSGEAEQPNIMEGLGLSPREREIAAMLLKGWSAKQISEELGITINTANFHIKNMYKKLGINSRSELFARFSPVAGAALRDRTR